MIGGNECSVVVPGAAAAAHEGKERNGTVAAAVGCTHVVKLRHSEAPNVGGRTILLATESWLEVGGGDAVVVVTALVVCPGTSAP